MTPLLPNLLRPTFPQRSSPRYLLNLPRRSESRDANRSVASAVAMTPRMRQESASVWCHVRIAAEVVSLPPVESVSVPNLHLAHPTCLKLADQAEIIHSYDWQCTECKTCEVCREKDGDVCCVRRLLPAALLNVSIRIASCSVIRATEVMLSVRSHYALLISLDSGWHMECLDPPIDQAPPGLWYCPACPPPPPDPELSSEQFLQVLEANPIPASPIPPRFPVREASVASSSRSVGPNGTEKSKKKGKARAVTTDESEVDVEDVVTPSRPSRRKSQAKWKSSENQLRSETEPDVEETAPPDSARPSKRLRVRLSSPVPSSPKPTKIRLRLPARKGKERAEETDDGKKGMFDDILPPEERDIGPTSILQPDKTRFEKSRSAADVCSTARSHMFCLIVGRKNSCRRRCRLTRT